MKDLAIPATKNTPSFFYDKKLGILSIRGVCHPENVKEIFLPVFNWLDDFKGQVNNLPNGIFHVHFFFRYLNSASLKHVAMFLQRLNQLASSGISVEINWQYEEDDEDMKETCQELFSFLDLKMKYSLTTIPYQR